MCNDVAKHRTHCGLGCRGLNSLSPKPNSPYDIIHTDHIWPNPIERKPVGSPGQQKPLWIGSDNLMLSEPIMMNLPFFIYNQSGMFVLLQEITNWWYNSKQHIISKFSSQIAIVYLYHFCSLYTFSTGYIVSLENASVCAFGGLENPLVSNFVRSIFHYF